MEEEADPPAFVKARMRAKQAQIYEENLKLSSPELLAQLALTQEKVEEILEKRKIIENELAERENCITKVAVVQTSLNNVLSSDNHLIHKSLADNGSTSEQSTENDNISSPSLHSNAGSEQSLNNRTCDDKTTSQDGDDPSHTQDSVCTTVNQNNNGNFEADCSQRDTENLNTSTNAQLNSNRTSKFNVNASKAEAKKQEYLDTIKKLNYDNENATVNGEGKVKKCEDEEENEEGKKI